MKSQLIWPMLVQVCLTSAIYVRLLVVKSAAAKAGAVDRSRIAIHPDAWPDTVAVVNHNLTNQFQLPILFYVLTLALMTLDAVDTPAVVAAWGFALSRLAHAGVHLGSNHVPTRMRLFVVGFVMVFILAGLLARAGM